MWLTSLFQDDNNIKMALLIKIYIFDDKINLTDNKAKTSVYPLLIA